MHINRLPIKMDSEFNSSSVTPVWKSDLQLLIWQGFFAGQTLDPIS